MSVVIYVLEFGDLSFGELEFSSRIEFRPRRIVGGHDDRHTRLADTIEQVHDLASGLDIEVARRFVRKNQSRCVEQGTCDNDTLLLSTRELVWHFVCFLLHTDLL